MTYDPDRLPWPDLDDTALTALRSLPFWAEAITTEREAGATITAYAATVQDRVLRQALELQAEEERRHARLVEALTTRYRIAVEPRPMRPPAADVELAFVDLGYGECVDSFFAFGLFALARRAGFVPDALLQLMEPVVAEEARHIVFFVNWEAYHQAVCRRLTMLRRARACRFYLRAARRRLGALRNARGEGFTASGARSVRLDLGPREFLETCLHENAVRLGSFDPRLVRPRLLPALASIALGALRVAARVTRHETSRRAGGSLSGSR
jgi:hypothetical protein